MEQGMRAAEPPAKEKGTVDPQVKALMDSVRSLSDRLDALQRGDNWPPRRKDSKRADGEMPEAFKKNIKGKEDAARPDEDEGRDDEARDDKEFGEWAKEEEGEESHKEDASRDDEDEDEDEDKGEDEKKSEERDDEVEADAEEMPPPAEGTQPAPMAADKKRRDAARADDKRTDDKRSDDDDRLDEARSDRARADSVRLNRALLKRLDALEKDRKRLEALERDRNRSDDETDRLAALQQSWGEVSMAHGDKTTLQPRVGESSVSYDRRFSKRYQKHSADWKDIDLGEVAANVLRLASPIIRRDAMSAAYAAPAQSAVPMLREVQKRDRTGRIISEFVGPVNSANGMFAPFRLPRMRARIIPPSQQWNF